MKEKVAAARPPAAGRGRGLGVRQVFLLSLLPVLSVGGPPAEAPAWEARRYKVPRVGVLELAGPSGWKQDVRRYTKYPRLDIEYTPRNEDASVLLTMFWSSVGGTGRLAARRTTEALRERALQTSDEDDGEVEILELLGESTAGYYFSVTQSNPDPGSWKYLTMGRVAMGPVLLGFSVSTTDSFSELPGEVIRAIRGATFAPADRLRVAMAFRPERTTTSPRWSS